MLELFDTLSKIGVLGVASVQPQKAVVAPEHRTVFAGVAGVFEHGLGHPRHRLEHQHTSHNLLKKMEGTPATPATSEIDRVLAISDPTSWLPALIALDPSRPPAGIMPGLWLIILADARWIARVHANNAAALGWSASDLFGIGKEPGNGGLADHLEGARSLVFTSSVAHWRGDDGEGWLWRRTLTPKPLLWET